MDNNLMTKLEVKHVFKVIFFFHFSVTCLWWPRILVVLARVEIISQRSSLLRSQYRGEARRDSIAAALCAPN